MTGSPKKVFDSNDGDDEPATELDREGARGGVGVGNKVVALLRERDRPAEQWCTTMTTIAPMIYARSAPTSLSATSRAHETGGSALEVPAEVGVWLLNEQPHRWCPVRGAARNRRTHLLSSGVPVAVPHDEKGTNAMTVVMIGVDPHRGSHTAVAVDRRGRRR